MQTLRPVLADLDFLFRLHGLRVRIVEASLADAPADMIAGGYSPALGPFLQICIPYAADGDSGVVDFDGPLRPSDIAAILERACSGQPVDWPALRAATAALDSEHAAAAAVDGDASTYWSAEKLGRLESSFEKVEVDR